MSCAIKRIIQLKTAIIFQPIKIINSNNIDITNNCEFSWSIDGVCWTCWVDYSNYVKICSNIESDFYLKIKIKDSIGKLLIGGIETNCYSITLDNENIFLKNFCDDPNLFQPYNNLDCALQLQAQLSDSIICMFGIPIYYFKVNPIKDTADYTFKEYILHQVESVKQIKLMIQDGQMPSSNYRLNEFDFDWETDWETEISKNQFAAAFGDNAYPNSHDFIYIPMMKRMWEVNAAYDEKNEGLMWRSTTWKLSLVKYNDSTNIDANDYEDMIDSLLINKYEDVFKELEINEQHREVGADPLSSPNYAANNLYNIFNGDAVRSAVSQNIIIEDKMICNKNNICSRNIYKLKQNDQVIYQSGICGDEGTIIFLIYIDKYTTREPVTFLHFGNIEIELRFDAGSYNIIYNNNSVPVTSGVNMVVCKWSHKLYITSLNVYKHIYKEGIPEYLIRPEAYWFDFQNGVISSTPFNNDYIMDKKYKCYINGPVNITNIKYYNRFLDDKEVIKESIKYTTDNEKCVINDLARPITVGHGYSVK